MELFDTGHSTTTTTTTTNEYYYGGGTAALLLQDHLQLLQQPLSIIGSRQIVHTVILRTNYCFVKHE